MPLPAEAGTVTIFDDFADGVEVGATADLRMHIDGGRYDSFTNLWSIQSGQGTIDAATGQFTAPATAQTVTVRITTTFRGEGTNAQDGTTATDSDDYTFTVNTAMAASTYQRLTEVDGGSGYVVEFTAENPLGAGGRIFEQNPASGMLLNHYPADMFMDTTLWWMERIRVLAAQFQLHRGGSEQSMTTFINSLPNEWTIYLLDMDNEVWIAWQANSETNAGNGFANYLYQDITNARHGGTLQTGAELQAHFGIGGYAGTRTICALVNDENFDPFP